MNKKTPLKNAFTAIIIITALVSFSSCGSTPAKNGRGYKNSRKAHRSYDTRKNYRLARYHRKSRYSSTQKKSTQRLIRDLKSYRRYRRLAAARELGNRKNDKGKTVVPLAMAMSDYNRRVRRTAYRSLVKLDEETLARALKTSYSERYKTNACKRAVESRDKRILRIYRRNLSKSRTRYTGASAKCLSSILSNRDRAENFGLSESDWHREIKTTAKALVRAYSRSRGRTKKRVRKALVDLGEKAHNEAVKQLGSYNSKTRKAAAELIAHSAEAFQPAIKKEIQKNNPRTLRHIIGILHLFPDPSLSKILLDKIKNGDMHLSPKVTRFLGNLGTDEGRQILESLLPDASGHREGYIIQELGKIGNPASIPLLAEYINALGKDTRKKTAEALGLMNSKRTIPPLVKRLKRETDVHVLKRIYKALARLNARSAVPAMIQTAQRKKSAASSLIRAVPLMPDRRFLSFIINDIDSTPSYRYKNMEYHENALAALGPATVPACRRLVYAKKSSRRDKQTGLAALAKMRHRPSVPFLINRLRKERDYSIRGTIMKTLGEIGDPRAVNAIISAGKKSSIKMKKALVLMGKPAISKLKWLSKKGRSSRMRKRAAQALMDIYNAYAECRSGTQLLKMKKYSLAEKKLQRAVKKKHNLYEAKLNLGVCYYHRKKYNKAARNFRMVIKNSPRLRAAAELNLGATLQRQGKTGQARFHTMRARALKKNITGTWYNHGWLLDEKGRLTNARHDLDRAMRLRREHFKALIVRAAVHAKEGRPGKALADLDTAEGRLKNEDRELKKLISRNRELLKKGEQSP